ncbi:hypothetical protein [Tenacibaculum sp. nBUS_03]|uniref:hypothetical protein n=1 Tax=Tenacibaculum sp. nBUS_03 TaxID=3395320 RepID=UPI003EB98703
MLDIRLETLGGTDIEPTGGMVHDEIYVAFLDDLEKIGSLKSMDGKDTANVATTIEELATITESHMFKEGKGFTRIKAIQDKNGIESSLIGEQKLVFENKLNVVVQGSDPTVLGALRMYKGKKPLLVLAREAGSGRVRQLGDKSYGAILSEGTPKVASEKEGENNVAMVFTDKNVVAAPVYLGDINLQPKPKPVL